MGDFCYLMRITTDSYVNYRILYSNAKEYVIDIHNVYVNQPTYRKSLISYYNKFFTVVRKIRLKQKEILSRCLH